MSAASMTSFSPQELQAAYEVFHSPNYLRHNARRLEHLASLGLDLHGRSVLELGAGIGDHTTFFLDRDCSVVSVEPRPENCHLFRQVMSAHRMFKYTKTERRILICCDIDSLDQRIQD